METENIEAKKKQMLEKLLLKKEDTLKELETLIEMSRNFFMIESETGSIILNSDKSFSAREKIILLFVGRYFAKEIGVLQKDSATIGTISKELDIVNTSLSGPLKELMSKGVIKKNNDGEYYILYHQIKSVLQTLKS